MARAGTGVNDLMWALGGPLFLTLHTSVIQSVAVIYDCMGTTPASCTGDTIYGISLGLVSAAVIFIYGMFYIFLPSKLPTNAVLFMAFFLFWWWAIGTFLTTFNIINVPFTGSGYFGSWAALIFTSFILHYEFAQVRHWVNAVSGLQRESKTAFYNIVASIVVVVSGGISFGKNTDPYQKNLAIFAMVAGAVSLIVDFVLLNFQPENLAGSDKYLSMFLVLFWTVAVGVLTIDGPFIFTQASIDFAVFNGFFSVWAAFLTSFFIAQHVMFPKGG